MKTLLKVLLTGICLYYLVSCTEHKANIFFPASSFVQPFPGRTQNLTYKLGNEFAVLIPRYENTYVIDTASNKKSKLVMREVIKKDTIFYIVHYDNRTKMNSIINKNSKDTLFFGTACKYKGLLFLNQKWNDSTYWISAIHVTKNAIIGLNTFTEQMFLVDNEIIQNKHKDIVLKLDTLRNNIRLVPKKKTMKKLYFSVIERFKPLELIDLLKPEYIASADKEIDIEADTETEENEVLPINTKKNLIEAIYPNPTTGPVTLEFSRHGNFTVEIYENAGSLKQRFVTDKIENKIDLSSYDKGIYYLKIYSPETHEVEMMKVLLDK